jgi:multidrug efflux pump subunit AcrA (membrane-fusion protein)
MKVTKKTFIAIGLVVLVVAVGYNIVAGVSKAKNIQVKKVNITNRVVKKTVSASGVVKALKSSDLAFPASQTITKLYVKKGEVVQRNDLLAVIDSSASQMSMKAAKDTRDYYIRSRDIFLLNESDNRKSLGNKEFELKLRQYNEQVDQYEATYQAAIAGVNNYYLYAPFDGTVLDVYKEEGEMALAGESVFKVADLSKVEFEVTVDQEDYGLLENDMAGEVSLDAFNNKILTAKLENLPLYADGSANPTFVVKLAFENTAETVPLVGMTGDVKIVVSSTITEVPSLYYDEIYFDEEKKPYVWVIENGFLSKLPIEIGIEGDLYTEVKTTVGKQIVVGLTADLELKDGYKALVVK